MLDYTITGIKKIIARRVGDPNGDTYLDRSEDYFMQALSETISNREQSNEEEVPELIVEHNISLIGEIGEITINSFSKSKIKIDKIYQTGTYTNYVKMSKISLDEFIDILSNPNKRPYGNEGYYCVTSGKIKYIMGDDFSDKTFACATTMSPSTMDYENQNLISYWGFSERLILRAIDLAVKLLKQEISME